MKRIVIFLATDAMVVWRLSYRRRNTGVLNAPF
jgi:hypothetical protein